MPLADQVRGIAGLAQLACQRGQRLVQRKAVVPDAGLGGVAAGKEHGARRRADRLIGDGVGEVLAARRQRIEIGRTGGTVEAVRADEVPAELVGEIKNDVRLLLRGLRFVLCIDLWSLRHWAGRPPLRYAQRRRRYREENYVD